MTPQHAQCKQSISCDSEHADPLRNVVKLDKWSVASKITMGDVQKTTDKAADNNGILFITVHQPCGKFGRTITPTFCKH